MEVQRKGITGEGANLRKEVQFGDIVFEWPVEHLKWENQVVEIQNSEKPG